MFLTRFLATWEPLTPLATQVCKWFSMAQEIRPNNDFKCRGRGRKQDVFSVNASRCHAGPRSKWKKPKAVFELRTLGLWPRAMTTRPSWHGLQWLWLLPDRWLISGPDLIFLREHWRSHVQAVGWWSCGGAGLVSGLNESVSADLMIFLYFFYYAGRVHWFKVRQSARLSHAD